MNEKAKTELANLRAELEKAGAGSNQPSQECPLDWSRLTVAELTDAEALMAKHLEAGEELSPAETERLNGLVERARV